MYPDAKPGKLVTALLGWLMYGQFPVTFFITLSGFCLMIPVIRSGVLRGGTKGFLFGRVRRILPPYYSALVLSVFVVSNFLQYPSHTWYDLSLPITTKGILAHVFLVQNLHWSWTEINGPLWTTAIEFQIYLLFPFLVWMCGCGCGKESAGFSP
jgi:peptidoglycan/LPS O-acetylase OafA/YrhL